MAGLERMDLIWSRKDSVQIAEEKKSQEKRSSGISGNLHKGGKGTLAGNL